MELSKLIKQANNTYKLRLDKTQQVEVQRRLICAGFRSHVPPNVLSVALDAVFDCADHLKGQPQLAIATVSTYGAMKVEAAAQTSGCVRCQGRLHTILLVNDRDANYCPNCNITLPNRA